MSRRPSGIHTRSVVRMLLGAALLVCGRPLPAEEGRVEQAMTVLRKNCVSCHNEHKAKGGLLLTSRDAALEGGDGGPALVPGNPEESVIVASLIAGADPHMPPKKQLAPEKIETLREWVREGAAWNAEVLAGSSRAPVGQLAPLPGSYQPVLAVALSPNNQLLAAGCGNTLVIYNAAEATLPLIGRVSAHPDAVQSVAWSSDGKRIATGAFRRVVIWDAESLEVEAVITTGLTDRISALRFIPNGSKLVVADGRTGDEGTIHLVDSACGSVLTSWRGHGDTIFDLALSEDGKYLATAGGDRLVKIWDLENQSEVAKLEGHVAQVLTVGFDPKGERLISGGADQQLKVWDVKTKDRIMTLGSHSEAINTAAWIGYGTEVLAITEHGGMLRYSDMKVHEGTQSSSSGKERKLENAGTELYCMAATEAGDRIYAGSHDGRIFAWNKDGKLVQRLGVNESKTTAALAK